MAESLSGLFERAFGLLPNRGLALVDRDGRYVAFNALHAQTVEGRGSQSPRVGERLSDHYRRSPSAAALNDAAAIEAAISTVLEATTSQGSPDHPVSFRKTGEFELHPVLAPDGTVEGLIFEHGVPSRAEEAPRVQQLISSVIHGLETLGGAVPTDLGADVAQILDRTRQLERTLARRASNGPQAGNDDPGAAEVLIVDDSREVRRVLGRMLRHSGYESLEASDGVDALELLDTRELPDVVVLDLMMPRMDGVETYHALRERSTELPILVISGYHPSSLDFMSEDPKARFLPKPFSPSEVLEALAGLLAPEP